MPEIKPVHFPDFDAQRLTPVNRPGPLKTPGVQPTAKPGKATKTRATGGTQLVGKAETRQQKLDNAIDVLRSKSLQLYHPDRKRGQPKAALGQFIDIKA